ncbi:MAG TPA: phosphoethanolamine transferase [Sulfuricurvum kujiense]|uniref:Phosphoethanolamine transferase n=1 Tax=Sulfuricurvum kujiense TaxID=148813 RepID=A0A2D3WHE4_9BACT|nr:phosphoethanolamine--lipid A transferase [Sulfuricurvum kujiense]DAB39315.1 MAG TPA: phosphoethanolamine transferase [Sulfuricurvum kujiense]
MTLIKPLKSSTIIFWTALFWVVFANIAFFKNVIEVYPLSWANTLPIISLAIVMYGVSVLLLTLLSNRWLFKPLLTFLLILTSSVAYFMDTYNIVVDTHMITNIFQTNVNESADLLSLKMVLYIGFLGIVPSWILVKTEIVFLPLRGQLIRDAKTVVGIMVLLVVVMFAFSKFYTSFFREHKPLRYYTNPAYPLYSMGKYVFELFKYEYRELMHIGEDASIPMGHTGRDLVIVVVGEAARADHFSLNGYAQETNPLLREEDIINFTDVSSCGTETAVSVPCMFSALGREDYDGDKAKNTENIIDILTHHIGVNVLWRDNNSDSKGVAVRAEYEDFKTSERNPLCEDGECRDEGMLYGLDEYIKAHPKGDILIVLHQMGNHGPAYHKRYPKEYEKFTPVCKTNQLEQCSQAEIVNAYDNAILYTDAFLAKTINFLKKYDGEFDPAMIYVSDHGESLGENGLYLHGFPYAIAPDAQKKVPMIMWIGDHFGIDKAKLKKRAAHPYTHDHLFHTLLNAMEVKTSVYQAELDIFHGLR